jgi:NADPH2:quinone reductase
MAMQAAHITATGGPDSIKVGTLPDPVAGPGEVLVRVTASALNPIDLYIRAGTVPMALPNPFIPGCDFAGTVEAAGPGVTDLKPGDRVWGSNQGLLGRQGTLAEKIAVKREWAYPSPPGVTDEALAATALVGITAHLALFRNAGLKAGEFIYIPGGTGGVGSMLVAMAVAAGAKVLCSVGNDEKARLAQSWGAETVVHRRDDIPARISAFTGGKGLDVWIETQREPDFMTMVPAMAPRGRMVLIAGRAAQPVFPVGPFYVKGLTLTGFAMFNATAQEQAACASDISRWLTEGKIRTPIAGRFPLSQAAEAHRFLEASTLGMAGQVVGKVVVNIG